MVAQIHVLPPALASQIAAGEVVERPASAAKELIENALDAQACRCDVSCSGGGVGSLSVQDDGFGMSEEDAVRAVERHATSKLTKISDLNHLLTFGFRGEALPSIASVSRFSLRTRTKDSDFGCNVEVEGGAPPVVRREGMPVGSTVIVKDLFFNVPARRKFLRSTGTESAHVTAAVEGAALSRHDVTFTLERDGRKIRELLRVGTRRDRVLQLLPEETLVEISGERGPMRLEAHLSRPERARPGASGLWLLVNGRVVRDRMIAATVAQAYGAALAGGNYPRGVVYLDLPNELVDVNVHPQKAEVRFVDPRALADAIYSVVSRAVTNEFALPAANRGARYTKTHPDTKAPVDLLPVERGLIPNRTRENPTDAKVAPFSFGVPPIQATPKPERGEPHPLVGREPAVLPSTVPPPATSSAATESLTNARTGSDADDFDEPAPPTMQTPPSDPLLGTLMGQLDADRSPEPHAKDVPHSWGRLRFLAQVRLTFLVCEGKDGLYIIDQHAAAERVAYAKLFTQYKAQSMASQALLFPAMVELLPKEVELVEANLHTFCALGLDVRVRGQDRISVHSTPRLLSRASPERLVQDLLSELSQKGGRGFSTAIEQAIALMACHGSLRAGEVLTAQQAQALLGSLEEIDITTHCAHGRPVVAVTRFTDLERQVGRR